MGRTAITLLAAASAFLALACSETHTPTEPGAEVVATPTPTVVSGQPAVVSGVVLTQSGYAPFSGLPVSGATLSCQGKSTKTGPDGSYQLAGVTSGPTDFTIVWEAERSNSSWHADLKPGSNFVNIYVQY